MATTGIKSPRVALDTNFIIDYAEGNEPGLESIVVLRKRRLAPSFIVTPTVLQELANLADYGPTADKKRLALKGLKSLRGWGFKPLNMVPVDHGIAERISDEMRSKQMLPFEERNDSFVVAEAALCNCDLLISSDQHITGIDRDELHRLLGGFHVKCVEITWPQKIIKLFGGK